MRMTHNAPAFRRRRSSETKEQLRQYFEVQFRTEKYGVPYFFGVSEATHGKRPQEQERGAVEDLNGGDPRADAGRMPFNSSSIVLKTETDILNNSFLKKTMSIETLTMQRKSRLQ
jgi:hypothetical protein